MKTLRKTAGGILALLTLCASCGQKEKSIVILHENDAHCALEGYAVFAGLRDAVAAADTAHVFAVSSGDFLQGGAMGTLSKGRYPVDVIRKVRYDVMVPGNHEFDYGMQRMQELCGPGRLGCPMVCANLMQLDTSGKLPPQRLFPACRISRAGNKRIAWIGATTPQAIYSEAYAFYDGNGRQLYDLSEARLARVLQNSIDEARAQGADYVILLSHLGDRPCKDTDVNSRSIVAATHGIDVVLDGHNHALIPEDYIPDANGNAVLLVQCGSKFSHIGKLVIRPDGNICHQTLPTADIPYRSQAVQESLDSISTLTDGILKKDIGHSDFDLLADDGCGHRLVRNQETNLGDLVSDALRQAGQAEIGLINGGSLRENIPAGPLTYRSLFDALPYHNAVCKIWASGRQIRQVLENSLRLYPEENGGFIQVSGLRYTLSRTRKDEAGSRISRIEVRQADGSYRELADERHYSVAVSDYMLGGGDGNPALSGCRILERLAQSDTDIVAQYILYDCGGEIPGRYAAAQGRILPARPQ